MIVKTLIFDLDGTLADCKELHQAAFRSAVKEHCPQAEYQDEEVEGLPTREKMAFLHSKGYKFDRDKLNQTKQEYTQAHIGEFVIYNPELEQEIKRLAKKYKLCVASNATQHFVYKSLDILRITRYFTMINTATQYPAKPDPLTFVDCMTACSSNSFNTVIFEDSEVGIIAAEKVISKNNVVRVKDAADTLRLIGDF